MSKQYGLIIPDKKVTVRPKIFDEDSESDEDSRKPTGLSSLKKQELRAQQKAVAEDPTVYQYDELYDEMQSQRKESKLARKDLDRKPKYISKLLESAERRKRENERRIEREVQKEREAEGDEFKDKESFVTNSYRKKLEEMKVLDDKEKRDEYLESVGDVRKQNDLSGFYRHLYSQQLNDDTNIEVKTDIRPENSQKNERKRKYRKRDSESSDETEKTVKLEHLPSNIDADSDFEIDSDSDSENESKPKTVDPPPVVTVKEEKVDEPVVVDERIEEVKPIIEMIEPEKPKVDIWKKRTVGELFDEALRKFFERKAQRTQSF